MWSQAWLTYKSSFKRLIGYSAGIYIVMVGILILQTINHLLFRQQVLSPFWANAFGTTLGLFANLVTPFIEPLIYLLVSLTVLESLVKIPTTSMRTILKSRSGAFFSTALIFYFYFVTIQQIVQMILLTPFALGAMNNLVDIQTLQTAQSLKDVVFSINIMALTKSAPPFTLFMIEFLGLVIAMVFSLKYFLYMPVVAVEGEAGLTPLKHSSLLVKRNLRGATNLYFVVALIPYLINALLNVAANQLFAESPVLGLPLANSTLLGNIASLIAIAINIFVYPLMALPVIYFYLNSREQAGEPLEEIVTNYQESYQEK